MSRNNSVNCRFLVGRPSGSSGVKSFAYFRRWSEDIVPFVQGLVVLDWKRQTFLITGKQQIKIALSTSDLAIARDRWAPVHARIEQILAQAHHAFLRSKNAVEDESSRKSDEIRISDEHLQLMAEQMRFDMISNADRQLEGDTAVSPVQRIIERAARDGDGNLAGLSDGDIEIQARRIEQKVAQRLFATRDLDAYEFAIRETELDMPAPSGFTPQDIGTVPTIEGFVPNEVGYVELDRGKIISQQLLHSPAHQALENNGYDLRDNITNRSQLAWKLWRGEVETRADLVDRARGRRIEVSSKRPELEPRHKVAKRTLVDLFQNWTIANEPRPKTITDTKLYMNRFILMNGDLDVREVGIEHLIAFRRGLLAFPRVVPTKMREATFKKLIAYGETLAQSERLDRRTVNKGINAIGTLLKMAIGEGLIDRNVAAGCRLKITDKKERQKLPFTTDELNRLVASPIFIDPKFRPQAGGGDAAFWLPLLAMFTACRMEELGQLLMSDVKIIDGIAYLAITDIPDESERKKKKDANKVASRAKHVKSEAANREVPLHPEILRLGFMEYVAKTKKVSKDRLFPDLRGYGDKVTKNFSRYINRYIDTHVTDDPRKNFHSFRHGAIDALRNHAFETVRVHGQSNIPSTLSEAVGHADTATTELYGLGSSIQKLHREISKLEYKGLDLSKVRSE